MSARRDARDQLALDSDAEIARCPHCGVTNDGAMKRIDGLRENIEGLERDLRTKRSTITRLQSEGSHQLTNSKHYPDALNVLEHWRDVCHPDAREIKSGERLKNVHDRLKGGYRPDQLMECADGYAVFAYVVDSQRRTSGPPSCRRIDAELIYRDPKHVDQGLAFAEEAKRRLQNIPNEEPTEVQDLLSLSQCGVRAVKYALFGWHVFPVQPGEKAPATRNGLLDATVDTARITKFWKTHPDFNVGIRCGFQSSLVVLDVDGDEGIASLRTLEQKFEPLPTTASVVTPRGGSHFYFRHPGVEIRNTTGYPGPGLDIRGDGGYVLAPPSVVGKPYEVDEVTSLAGMPDWLTKLLLTRQTEASGIRKDYAEIVKNGVREGERNSQLLSLAGHLWSHEHEPDEVLELVDAVNQARCSPPLPAREVENIVASVGKMRSRQALRSITS